MIDPRVSDVTEVIEPERLNNTMPSRFASPRTMLPPARRGHLPQTVGQQARLLAWWLHQRPQLHWEASPYALKDQEYKQSLLDSDSEILLNFLPLILSPGLKDLVVTSLVLSSIFIIQ